MRFSGIRGDFITHINKLAIISHMTQNESKYDQQVRNLEKAVNIARKVINESVEIPSNLKESILNHCSQIIYIALNPEPQFRKIASLRCLENDFFIFWNESQENYIETFWTEIYKNDLGYERKDVLSAVLKRKKIKNIHEFDFIIDNILFFEQTNRIDKSQIIELNNYIADFEKRNKIK